MFESMRLGLHATGDSMLCPLALLGLGMPTVESPVMMAVTSEWSFSVSISIYFAFIRSIGVMKMKSEGIWLYHVETMDRSPMDAMGG